MQSTGMYEAAGNLLWADPFQPEEGAWAVIAGEPLQWLDVEVAADMYFSETADQRGHLPAASQGTVGRLMFPTTLYAHIANESAVDQGAFDSELILLSGHLHVAAWYWAVYSAIEVGDRRRLAAMWQCALTVTIHLRAGMPLGDLAVLSIQISEQLKTGASMASDTFVAFAKKALLVIGDAGHKKRMKLLNHHGVRFNGSIFSMAMMTTR